MKGVKAMVDVSDIRRKIGGESLPPTPMLALNTDLVAHELANIMPLIVGQDFENLKADIKEKGILEPIRLFEGKILDGRNRYRAAKEVGHEFSAKDFKEFAGSTAEAEAYV